jgi:hypothetical protein
VLQLVPVVEQLAYPLEQVVVHFPLEQAGVPL